METANRFKECREKTQYTQKQVALLIGVKPPQLSKWESGTGRPSRENCIKLAQLYGVTIDYLLGNEQEQVVSTSDDWDVEAAFSDPDDDSIRIMARGMGRMSPENRQKLLDVARTLFAEDFDEKGNKK